MKIVKPKANPRYWSEQQQVLRRLLMKDKDYSKAIVVFLSQHGMVHSAKLNRDVHWSCQDEVLSRLTDEQMRCIPKGRAHSVVWMIWHLARVEDVTMNLLLADSPQVLQSGNWLDKLKVTCVNVGNEMSIEEIVKLSQAVNLKALFAYRLAVGKRTRDIVRRINLDELGKFPAPERLNRIAEERAVRDKASGLLSYWGGHINANLLLMPATRHCFIHLNEARRMLPMLRLKER